MEGKDKIELLTVSVLFFVSKLIEGVGRNGFGPSIFNDGFVDNGGGVR
jgi:hypothetical protein